MASPERVSGDSLKKAGATVSYIHHLCSVGLALYLLQVSYHVQVVKQDTNIKGWGTGIFGGLQKFPDTQQLTQNWCTV
jgi:hypothetical protein